MIKVLNSRSRTWSGPVTVTLASQLCFQIYGQRGTALRGEVHITLSLKGGDPYKSSCPAVTRAQLEITHPKTPARCAGKTPKVAAKFAGNESCSTIQSDQYFETHEMPQAVGTYQSPYGGGRHTPGG